MIATSPGAPICSVPIFGARLMILAGAVVAIVTTCSSEKPRIMNLLMTFGRYGTPGELPENTWMSEEIVSGPQPPGRATSATVKSKLPPPWPTSNITPRCLAESAAGNSLPSWTMLVNPPAIFGAPE